MNADGQRHPPARPSCRKNTLGVASRRWIRRLVGVAIAVAATIGGIATDATPAFADDGLAVVTNTTYTVNPEAGVVDAVQVSTFTNTVPNETVGNQIQRTYFDGSKTIIPSSAVNVSAQTDGVPLTIERNEVDDSASFQVLTVRFNESVFYQSTTTVEIRYSIEGAAPRDTEDISRVNPAFAGFWAIAAGDTDQTTLTVVVPETFEVDPISDLSGSAYQTIDGNRSYVYTGASQAAADGDTGWQQVWVAVSNPNNLESAPVNIGDATFDVRGWGDDPDWTAFVTQTVSEGVPQLENLFGVPWPGQATTEVRESITPYFYGYGGWYSPESGIEIGEDLDKVLVLHELSHGWVNHDSIDERWMIEGMAEYAGRTAAGDTEPLPEPNLVGPLLDWNQPLLTDADEDTEERGYATSYYVTATIFDQIGPDRFDDVFAFVSSDDDARYGLEDWQAFLDAAEPIVGTDATDSTFVADIFTTYVTDDAGTALIQRRNVTRTDISQFNTRTAGWPGPSVIEQSTRRWDFEAASQEIGWATTTLEARDQLHTTADEVDLEVGTDQFAESFGTATTETDFDVIDSQIAELDTTIDEVVSARTTVESSDGFFATIGSWWRDDPDAHLDAATQALAAGDAAGAADEAAQADELASAQRQTGAVRFTIAIVVFVLFVVAVTAVIWRSRRRRGRSSNDTSDGSAVRVVGNGADLVSTPASASAIPSRFASPPMAPAESSRAQTGPPPRPMATDRYQPPPVTRYEPAAPNADQPKPSETTTAVPGGPGVLESTAEPMTEPSWTETDGGEAGHDPEVTIRPIANFPGPLANGPVAAGADVEAPNLVADPSSALVPISDGLPSPDVERDADTEDAGPGGGRTRGSEPSVHRPAR